MYTANRGRKRGSFDLVWKIIRPLDGKASSGYGIPVDAGPSVHRGEGLVGRFGFVCQAAQM